MRCSKYVGFNKPSCIIYSLLVITETSVSESSTGKENNRLLRRFSTHTPGVPHPIVTKVVTKLDPALKDRAAEFGGIH